jgi:excinuclease ABC subunit C
VAGRGEPLRLSRHAYALRLLQYVRDEAHRFAQHYHHILRRKNTLGDEKKPAKRRRKRSE